MTRPSSRLVLHSPFARRIASPRPRTVGRIIASPVLLLLVVGTLSGQTMLDSLRPHPREAYVRQQISAVWYPRSDDTIVLDPSRPAWGHAMELNAGLRAKGLDTMVVRLAQGGERFTRAVFLATTQPLWLNIILADARDQHPRLPSSKTDGYILDVMPQRVIIMGGTAQGLHHGIDTFLQLIRPSPTWWGLNACRIIDAPEHPKRWFYQATNLLVASNTTKAKALWSRAAALRLNGVHLTDYKFSILSTQPRRYFDSLAALKHHAEDLGMEIIPGVMPFGYSNGLLAHDPNLASGLPVRLQRFVIDGDSARLIPHALVDMPNGGFELRNGDTFPGFTFIDQPGAMSVADTVVVHSGRTSIRFQDFSVHDPANGNGRVCYWKRVTPFTQYHVRGWVRTENLQPASAATISVLSRVGYSLAFNDLNLPATTNGWRVIDFTFNSLGADSIGLYFGVWGAKAGRIWWDDLLFEECSFVNLIRRTGAPLTVTDPILAIVYTEGVDFDTLRDARLGVIPYAGEYENWHTPPTLHMRPGGSLHNGDTVLVSYCHMITIYGSQVMITLSDPKTMRIVEQEFALLEQALHPRTWFMQHDEIRTMNWDPGDQATGLPPGLMLAANVAACRDIIRAANKDADIWVWSDMFDDYHNAVPKNYYLVNGSLAGSADLLPKDIGIVNWNGRSGIVQNSLDFFASRGFRQISAPYYDSDADDIRIWKEWTRTTPAFAGMMYTTWQDDYTSLDAFAEYAWNHAPYIRHQPLVHFVPFKQQSLTFPVSITGDPFDAGWQLTGATLWYRLTPPFPPYHQRIPFIPVPFTVIPGVPTSVTIDVPDSAEGIMWYITADDNRGWRTRVPFEEPGITDSLWYEEGITWIESSTPPVPDPARLRLLGMHPQPVLQGRETMLTWEASPGSAVECTVFDNLGRVCIRRVFAATTGAVQQTAISTAQLAAGVHLVLLRRGGSCVTTKLLVASGM